MVRAQVVVAGAVAGGAIAAGVAGMRLAEHNRRRSDDYVLDVTQGRDPFAQRDREALLELRQILSASPTGQALIDEMDAGRTRVTIVDTELYRLRRPHSGGVFNHVTNEIQLPRGRVYADPQRAALTLAHEAQHAKDMQRLPESMRRARIFATTFAGSFAAELRGGAGVRDAYDGASALGVHAVRLHRDELEVNAYHVQAQVADELGLRYRGMGVDPATGERETREQTLERVQASVTYADGRMPGAGSDEGGQSPHVGHFHGSHAELGSADADADERLVTADPENTFIGADVRHLPRRDEERYRPRSAPVFDGGQHS